MSVSPTSSLRPRPGSYLGVALVAMSMLMLEILLTRIFSATSWYHFAFVAISVAMFGLTAGALVVYLLPERFGPRQVPRLLALAAFVYAVAIPITFLVQQSIPFIEDFSAVGLFALAETYVVISIPFFFAGVAICLALTGFSSRIGAMYAADLVGAALGCLLLIPLLDAVGGPTAALVIGALAALGALALASAADERLLAKASVALAIALVSLAAANQLSAENGSGFLRIVWVKGARESRPEYEKWNSFSRVVVYPHPPLRIEPVCAIPADLDRKLLRIDGDASTEITRFDGDVTRLPHLQCDVVNIAHHLRQDASVLVVGVGGGRDVLAALAFDQRKITGLEMNGNIIGTLTGPYADYSGHLERDPRVTFVNDEARSYLERTTERFDVLQISMIDTWAATAAGAFVLSESALYTAEAWGTFLERLTPDGVLTVSRWYNQEVYRAAVLAITTLRQAGVPNPRDHLVIVRQGTVATMLVSASPFSASDLQTLEAVSEQFRGELVLTPRGGADESLIAVVAGEAPEHVFQGVPLRLTAPTDDSPYFFHMIRLRDVFRPSAWGRGLDANLKAVRILVVLIGIVSVLTITCIIVPLVLTTSRAQLTGAGPMLVFFAAIGLGFMLIELSQMHRLVIFLGHPTYSLSVVLFAMLLSSAAGSFLAERYLAGPGRSALVLAGLVIGLLTFGFMTPLLIDQFSTAATAERIAVAVTLLFPLGLAMGTALPTGMRAASSVLPQLTPWYWGVNGAMSVLASVLATALALVFSISFAFWTGTACYVAALGALIWHQRRHPAV